MSRPLLRSVPRLLTLAACAFALRTAPARANLLPGTPTVDRLPNGLTIVTLHTAHTGIAAYYTLVRTGSRDELERGHSGYAHLFEHMMFHGTPTVPRNVYEQRMQALGADNNAYTTDDFTLYTVTLPNTSVADLIPLEADRFQHLAYDDASYQTETRAVLGEYNKNAANPVLPMWEALRATAFTQHTYAHTTLGFLEDVLAMPAEAEYSRRFFRRYYTPDNSTVFVVGDVDREAVLPLIRAEYGAWQGHRDTSATSAEPEQTEARRLDLAWDGPSGRRMFLGWRGPAFGRDGRDSVALEVVHALAFAASAPLAQRLVVQERKLLALESETESFHVDPELFVVSARLGDEASFDEVLGAIQDELARIGRGEVPREEITRVLSHLRYGLPMQLQTAASVANALATYTALTGDPNALEAYGRAFSLVTPEDVARVARTYLVPGHRTTITLSPADHAPAGARRTGPDPMRYRQPPPPTPATVTPAPTPSTASPAPGARPARPARRAR